MGLTAGGLNGRRFRTSTQLPEGFRDLWLDAVRQHALEPDLDASDGEPRVGWVDVFEPANRTFELNTFLFDRFVALSLRVDKKTVNGAFRKITLAERMAAIMEQRGVERLSKADKTEIQESLDVELLARALPSVSTCDVAWDTQSGEVIVFSGSESTVELVRAHFEATFDQRLRPERMCDWLAEKLTWTEIGERAERFLPGARGTAGVGAIVDGWNQDDPLEGAGKGIAADFITWLWLQSESSDGLFRVVEHVSGADVAEGEDGEEDGWNEVTETLRRADLSLWLESKLKLQDVSAEEAPDTTILLGVAPSVTPAARRDLHGGKRPVEARIGLKMDEIECALTVAAGEDGVQITGIKLPFEVKDGQEELVFERMMLLDLLHTTLRKLFQQFFLARTSPAWTERIEAWMAEDTERPAAAK
ncbi:MAG: recombination-associated protein RdgC [Alphaproteobacteria bacterium]|nr:recombination-associated protein RdgC [Alphaproteobacteria bacterium]